MKLKSPHYLGILSLLLCLHHMGALKAEGEVASVVAQDRVDWGEYLARRDMVWSSLPKNWKESPFLGNGEMGTMCYQVKADQLRWDIGCAAAHDHRPMADDDRSEKNVTVLNRGRHSIGHLEMTFPASFTGGDARLRLWDAEATGTLTSAGGKAEWSALVHASEPVLRIEVMGDDELDEVKFNYVAHKATSPRAIMRKTPRSPANPEAVMSELSDGVRVMVHDLYAGGQTAVAWKQDHARNKFGKSPHTRTRIWMSVQHSFPGKDARAKAVAAVRSASEADQAQWVAAHREWWHDYYPQSFISTGDAFWDAFYWAQQYKVASATRAKGWIIDNQGPWLQPTAWNAIWWNLNAQLSHSGFLTANRRGMGSALSYRLGINRDNLALNVEPKYRKDSYAIGRNTSGWDLLGYAGIPGKARPGLDASISRECGNLLWALHNVDLEYRYWQDTGLRDETLYPLLVRAVNYFRHFLVEEGDGMLHLPETLSPEYRTAKDCSYDIDLLRWGAERLIELAKEKGLSREQEPLLAEWERISDQLVKTHTNKTGFMIGRNVGLTSGHRHWSHLLSIYPLRTTTPETTENRELILRSLNHWHSFKNGGMGYSVTGGSCIASLLGDSERAFVFLERLKSFLLPNTFYVELGKLPVIETPLHGATAMQEMLLQSWGGRLRVFPATPEQWPDVQFHKLRGEGAFLVSARRESGRTRWVSVEAEAGGVAEIEVDMVDAQWSASEGVTLTHIEGGLYQVKAAKGGTVALWPKGEAKPELEVTAVETRGGEHRFGRPSSSKKK